MTVNPLAQLGEERMRNAPETIRTVLSADPVTPTALKLLTELTGVPTGFIMNPETITETAPTVEDLRTLVTRAAAFLTVTAPAAELAANAQTLRYGGSIPNPHSYDGHAAYVVAALLIAAASRGADATALLATGLRTHLEDLAQTDAHAAETQFRDLDRYLSIPL